MELITNSRATSRATTTRSSKYQHVEHTIDTGKSVNQVKREQLAKNYVKKPGELFKRIRTKTLAAFLDEWARNEHDKLYATDDGNSGIDGQLEPKRADTAADLLYNNTTQQKQTQGNKESFFLLLDVRIDEEQFKQCRIDSAVHYPSTMLSRSVNEFIPEIYAMRNKENKFIIVYDEDESVAANTATLMFQKGIDNVYLLSGGLRDMFEKFPIYVVGKLPPKPGTAKTKAPSSRTSTALGSSGGKSPSNSIKKSSSSPRSTLGTPVTARKPGTSTSVASKTKK